MLLLTLPSLCKEIMAGLLQRRAAEPVRICKDLDVDEIDLLVGWRAGEDEYLFTKAVAMVREWLLDTEEKDRLRDVLKEILAEAGPPAGKRPLD
jgi:hypothetical protein